MKAIDFFLGEVTEPFFRKGCFDADDGITET
jgi:hypothetical protein